MIAENIHAWLAEATREERPDTDNWDNFWILFSPRSESGGLLWSVQVRQHYLSLRGTGNSMGLVLCRSFVSHFTEG